ncbi:hypothetical protein GPALN_006959 [Globodera pallida]|nr:hypothetical protein GPALN_006959 [Globodera pallida]
MDEKSAANNNESAANSNESAANNNKSAANNKRQATTCGSGSNKIGPTNMYKYGPNYNKSHVYCCCGCVSIETGTYVAAIVLCVSYMIEAILQFRGFFLTQNIWLGSLSLVFFFACLLVVYAQHARNQWLFLPCLILGLIGVILIGYGIIVYSECSDDTLAELKKSSLLRAEYGNECTSAVIGSVLLIPLFVWLYSVILRGFCIEENKIVIPLGDIGPNQFKDNRAELNGLYIILNKNFDVSQLSREGALTHRSERELEWENVEDEKESEAVQEQSKFRHLFWILNLF